MSGSVENFNYVMYNEFEKPIQFTGQTPNLFEFKRILENSQSNLEPTNAIHTKPPGGNGERQLLSDDCGLKGNLAELTELLNSAAANKPGIERSVNVYNKCVFFVNSYGNEMQDASKILAQLTDSQVTSKRRRPESFEINDRPHLTMSVDQNHQLYEEYSDPIATVEPDVRSFTEDEIIVSDAEGEIAQIDEKSTDKLFFVDKDELKPILSPNVLPGVYKKVVAAVKSAEPPKDIKPNVYRSTSKKCGAILTAKEFSESYITNRDIAIKTDELICDSPSPAETEEPVEICLASNNELPPPEAEPDPSEVHVDAPNEEGSKPIGENDGSKDNLRHLAYDILKLSTDGRNLQFNREKNEIIHHRRPFTRKKVIYRILKPDDLDLTASQLPGDIKLANPTFVQSAIEPELPEQIVSPKKPRGRPRKATHKATAAITSTVQIPIPPKPDFSSTPKAKSAQENPTSSSRTRYGRVSKLPNFIESNFQIIDTALQKTVPTSFESAKDCDYRYNGRTPPLDAMSEVAEKRERTVPAESRCNVCNKVYLGKKKMLRHFAAYPDHFTKTNSEEIIKEMSLYAFLVKKVHQSALTEDQRISLLLNELTDFITQLQSRRSQLITHNSAIYFVNSLVSKLLAAPEGHYGVDLNALNEMPRPPDDSILVPPNRLDYNLSISLDDTIADAKLNLSENMITSDDSLLRTVDDLVKEGIKNLTEDDGINRVPVVSSVINYDHVNDNAVEAVNMKEMQPPAILDLSLDLFQFNSN